MKILIFTEGTILMHKAAVGRTRSEIEQQIIDREPSVKDYASYVPTGEAVRKINIWVSQGAEIVYLTSRKSAKEVNDIAEVLDRYNFPSGGLEHRRGDEAYKDVAERIMPDILIEDDCEAIGGEPEMTYTNIRPDLKSKITHITIKESGGIDHLPDDLQELEKISKLKQI